MLLPMPTKLSFVFLIDLILHFCCNLHVSALSTSHSTHHVIELILLIETLVKLPLIWTSLHHIILTISHRSSHHIHLLLELLIWLPLLHHVGLHLLLIDHASRHVIHLWVGVRAHHLLHILLSLHDSKIRFLFLII